KDFQDKKIYSLNVANNQGGAIISGEEQTRNLEEYIDNNKKFENFYIGADMIPLQNFKGIENFKSDIFGEDYHNLTENGYTKVKALNVGGNFINALGYRINEEYLESFQNYFENPDEYTEYVPVLLGDSYKKIFSLGDFIITQRDESFKVVGFLEKDQYCSKIGSFYPDNMENLNEFIIVPDNIQGGVYNNLLVFDNKSQEEIDKVLDDIIKKGEELGCPVSINDPTKEIEIFNENINYEINVNKLLLIIVSIFVFIGITTIMLMKISRNEKEYSIHLLTGATILDIVLRTFYEIVLTVIISAVVLFGTIVYKEGLSLVTMSNYGLSLLIFLGIAIVLSIIPSVKILRYNLSYLIKGEE
ncbi:MAG: hypothetical protein Q4B63_06670, partial [Clostridium perfringens]|nr:hypothetical protein [Clostridium perfringens]